ncbi:MAG TPA: translation elongation factor Ts, partial [Sphingomicrobium sp.]|nr:translation elongation factor Ts [Sphingomicrobium sp.]
VLVALESAAPPETLMQLGKQIAMHVAAAHPLALSAERLPAELVERERSIAMEKAKESGKPQNIIEKMVEGRIKKFLAEVTLLGQPFVKDPDQSVEKLVKAAGAEVLRFTRFEVGEGIEKKQEDFAAEVAAAAGTNRAEPVA